MNSIPADPRNTRTEMSDRQLANQLAEILRDSSAGLDETSARDKLEERIGRSIDDPEYDRIKHRLVRQNRLRLSNDDARSLVILALVPPGSPVIHYPITSQDQSSRRISRRERVDMLYRSLSSIPGIQIKRYSEGIVLLFGEDGDKLFAYWDPGKREYYFQYKIESGKPDCSAAVENIFGKACEGEISRIEKSISSISLYVGDSIPLPYRICSRIKTSLDDVYLENAHADFGVKRRLDPSEYYMQAARLIRHVVYEDLRLFYRSWRHSLAFDDVDHFIIVGDTGKGERCSYREHVVPVSRIKNEAIRMAMDGAPVEAIANLIQYHLYIVMITPEEAALLNSLPEQGGAGMKSSMPKNWKFGDDPFARLKSVGLTIRFHRLVERNQWKPWRKNLRDSIRHRLNMRLFEL